MMYIKGFAITIASGIAFAFFGALAGVALGNWVPDYYRTIFGIRPESHFEPILIGLGLGVTQGFALGVIVGLVIFVTVAWYESRVKTFESNRTRTEN